MLKFVGWREHFEQCFTVLPVVKYVSKKRRDITLFGFSLANQHLMKNASKN